MKSVLIKIEPKMLNWIKKYVKENFNNQELLNELETWDNVNKPRFTDVERMSEKIHIPFGDFILGTPPEDDDIIIIEFRSFSKNSTNSMSFQLRETIEKMEYIQAWMEEYLTEVNCKPLEYVGSDKELGKIELIEFARSILGIDEDWFLNFSTSYDAFTSLRKSFESIGILVMLNCIASIDRPLDFNECSAFVLSNNIAPLIFINSDNFKDMILSMLVEFVHILLGQNHLLNNQTNSESNEEKLCYEVAVNLVNLDSLPEHDLMNNKVNTKNSQTQENYNNQNFCLDNRFKKAVVNSINNGDLSYTDAFSMTDSNNTTFDEIIAV